MYKMDQMENVQNLVFILHIKLQIKGDSQRGIAESDWMDPIPTKAGVF